MLPKKHELFNFNDLDQSEVEKWVREGPDKSLIESVEAFGRYISDTLKNAKIKIKNKEKKRDESVSTSQIRQIFAKMKTLEAKGGLIQGDKRDVVDGNARIIDFLMLKPLMAYASSRHNTVGMKRLVERLDWALNCVVEGSGIKEKQKRFKNFCKLFEAILAYHRAYGGK